MVPNRAFAPIKRGNVWWRRGWLALAGLLGLFAAPYAQATLKESSKTQEESHIEKAKKKGKKSKFKVGARIMSSVGYRYRPDREISNERNRGLIALRQARLRFRYKQGQWRIKLSADLGDGIQANGERPIQYVRNAYAEWRPTGGFRLRLGNFKRPYSRIAFNNALKTPTIGRGLTYRYAIRRRTTNLAYGMRALGVMLWQKYPTALGEGRVYASVTQGGSDMQESSANLMISQALGERFAIDLFSTYKRSLRQNEVVFSNATGLALSYEHKRLTALAELHAIQDWLDPEREWGLGALGTAYYRAWQRKKVTLGPMLAAEWLKTRLEDEGEHQVRLASGLRAHLQDSMHLWLEGEWTQGMDYETPEQAPPRQLRLRLQFALSL